MKKLNYVLLLSFILFLIAGCAKDDSLAPLNQNDQETNLKKGHAQPVIVSVPLKADFTVWFAGFSDDNPCAPGNVRLIMVGEGNMSHLGKMTTRMDFCATGEPTGSYRNGSGKFVAANGDELYFDLEEGLIIGNEDEDPYYPTRFNDKVNFTGGTGRFEEATGYFWTNAYVHFPDPNNEDDVWHTDFFSYGILKLVKGKR